MEHQKVLTEILHRSKEDPWCQECLAEVQKYEETFRSIRSRLTEEEREQLDLYIAACEAWCDSHMFVAFELGQEGF